VTHAPFEVRGGTFAAAPDLVVEGGGDPIAPPLPALP